MIDVKEAARLAAEYFANLYDPNTYTDLQLEEVELTDDEKYWMITLSYKKTEEPPKPTQFEKILNLPISGGRAYKHFKIAADSGKVHAMTIRKVS